MLLQPSKTHNNYIADYLFFLEELIMKQIILGFYIMSTLFISVLSQQNYSGTSAKICVKKDQNGQSPTYLYSCNGQHRICQTFLILTSQPHYSSVLSISNLASSDPEELARINNVASLTEFQTNEEVIVPVTCHCTGPGYYQANTTYILGPHETYFIVANNLYQGLSPCSSLMRANPFGEFNLHPDMELQVPLRCACPTPNQAANGIKYLVTYSLGENDHIDDIAKRFNVSSRSILDANGFSEKDPPLFPSTVILIPLQAEPSSSQIIARRSFNNPIVSSPSPLASIPRQPKSKTKVYVVFAVEAGCVLLVLSVILIAGFLYYNKRSNRSPQRVNKERVKWVSPEDLRVEIASFEKVLRVFGFEEMISSTENFSPKNRIKGSVYYGVFGREIMVVKKTSRDASKEVNILKKINHFNLIKLEGVCPCQDRFCLVFEHMENGSLRDWLCESNPEVTLSWAERIQIALDVAQGLNYLHSFTEPAYVHKNIKTSNILLNRDKRAKIANFTLAGIATKATTTSSSQSTHMVGTRGYLAPEYLETGLATPKMDVYAFGVVILELISGKSAFINHHGTKMPLSAAVVAVMEGDNAEAELSLLMDPCLKGEKGTELALRIAKLSVACLMPEPQRRPSMGDVVSTLLKVQADLFY